jgi:hypothetical protein
MAWNNRDREPKREWIEQLAGFGFISLYVIIGIYCVPVARWLYTPTTCNRWDSSSGEWICVGGFKQMGFWHDPGDFFIVLGLMTIPWIIYPAWLMVHALGELACALLANMGLDPRPNPRERGY